MLVATGWLLAGCSTFQSLNPINWWHRQEGGKIAEQRPAPPGADEPYPNLGTVPPKPEAPDTEALRKLTASLVADRTNAQHAAQSAPLADPSSPIASPNLFGAGTAPPPPPPGASVASASMPAVTAPPPAPAPRKAVQTEPLEAPARAAASAPGASSTTPTTVAASANETPVGSLPGLPEGPPSRPAAAGAAPAALAAPVPMPAPSAGESATIVFPERASNLSQPATDEVKAFAAKRGNGTISVTGYGDSASSDPDAQSAAVNLGLSRAQSIVDALTAAGVPGTAVRISAEASGRGASLHLLQ